MNHTTIHILTKTTEALEGVFHDTQAAEHAAWWLLEKLTGKKRLTLVLNKEILLTQTQEEQLDLWLYEMVHDHKPLAYILGTVDFLGLTLTVEPPILIPRPETEEWCDTLIKEQKNLTRILDLCTGSGCIALALAKAFPQAHVIVVDIETQAISLTERNAQQNNISNIACVLSNLYTNIKTNERFDVIVSNPPYITDTEWADVELSVKNWEDPKALRAHDNGLAIIKRIIADAPKFLKKDGQLWLEIGYHQGPATRDLFKQAGFTNIKILKDYNGNDRVVCGTHA